MHSSAYYTELIHIAALPAASRIRYARMLGLLRRICLEKSADFQSDFATLFSRLLAVCRTLHIDHRPADRFRRNARLVLHEGYEPAPEEERADLADLCHFIKQVTGEGIPEELPRHIRPLKVKSPEPHQGNSMRALVIEVLSDEAFLCRLDDRDYECRVELKHYPKEEDCDRLTTCYIYKGANVMLLNVEPKEGDSHTFCVYMAVLEPDYLIDVSALTATIKPYGSSPLNYLLNLLAPHVPNRYNLLGDMANQFMDHCINGSHTEADKQRAFRKSYQEHVLDYACLDDREISPDFFKQADWHYQNIHHTVCHRFAAADVGIPLKEVLLEPSFICPALGLRGRLDVMTMNHQRVLELKSGKAEEEWHKPVGPKQDHLLQMTLYGEMLRRNFHIDWHELQTFLFYSVYPLFYNERPSATAIRQALHLRNGIVHLMHLLRQGKFERLLPMLTPEHLNKNGLTGKFFVQYLRPQIESVTRPLQLLNQDSRLRSYFAHFMTFVERERFMSKTSDNRPDSIRGFAATWTADLRTKLLAGNILTGLTIEKVVEDEEGAICRLCFALPGYDGEFVPNFSPGEMVQLYEATDKEANVTNRQLIRGVVAGITATTLTVELAYKQRNHQLFDASRRYAAEHDASDSPSTQQVRNLFSLLTATPRRRDLLLARRQPEADASLQLVGHYPEAVQHIVLQAKQARDIYLLVGPPGTGKTNMALRSMVQEFLLTRQADPAHAQDALLLTAYTNRAVDEICSMLNALMHDTPFDYLRLGACQTCAPEHRSHLLDERSKLHAKRNDIRKLIDDTPIFVGTVLTLTNRQILFRRRRFAAAIIDEASQLLEPQALGLLCAQVDGQDAIGKFIFIGDHKQLPAVVMLPESQTRVDGCPELSAMGLTDLRNSLFERLHAQMERQGLSQFYGMLHRQGRMHPDICAFVSRHFYENQLSAVPVPHQLEGLPWKNAVGEYEKFVATTRMGFVHVCPLPHVENLRANAPEALVVCRLIEAICSLHRKHGLTDFRPEKAIGVIVPFRSQIAGIRKLLRQRGHVWADGLTIDTVECYQGSQRDYILFSTTISEPYQLDILSAVQQVGHAQVDRKLNVALTRARKQLFIIGNRPLLSLSPIYKALIGACHVFTPQAEPAAP